MLNNFLVLGAGSAGLLAAVTFKRKLPGVTVRIVRSKELGVIGVGESTTPSLPRYLFDYLGIRRKRFYELAEPTWKLGIRFLWGPRKHFEFAFVPQFDGQLAGLSHANGFYCKDDVTDINVCGALMQRDKAFTRQQNGAPHIDDGHAFHLFNPKFVETLELLARDLGVDFIDGNVAGATRGPSGIASVTLEDGRTLEADFFIDASGFRSELLGKALGEPYVSFSDVLFNDRAIVGGWERSADDEVLPYTIAETMDAGWAWQIDHQTRTNRGYVFSSSAISEEAAREEFARKNPKAKIEPKLIRFRCGRHQRGWVENVMGIGNSCGFVEPLEATALMVATWQLQTFVDMISANNRTPSPTMQAMYNRLWASVWDEIRDFLVLHYKLNTRLDTPYWQAARNSPSNARLEALTEFYQQNGPTGFMRYLLDTGTSQFGVEGFLSMFVGNAVPYRSTYSPSEAESKLWHEHRRRNAQIAESAMGAAEALRYVKHPGWAWNDERKS